MSKAKTQEEKDVAKVVKDANSAVAMGSGASGLSQPMESVKVSVTAVLGDKDIDSASKDFGKHFSIGPQDLEITRPNGSGDNAAIAITWGKIAQMGGMIFKIENKTHLYPLTSIDHLEIEIHNVVGVTL